MSEGRQTQMPKTKFEFDIALSFAGEDRKYVEQVATRLQRMDLRVFYDEHESTNLWARIYMNT
jgi:hypothetical protein